MLPGTDVDALGRVVAPAAVAPLASAQRLTVGQSLRGTVVQVLPQNSALVHFPGHPLLLEPVPQLVPGQTIVATVEQIVPTLLLRLTDVPSLPTFAQTTPALAQATTAVSSGLFSAAQLKAYFAASQPFGDIVTRLTDLLAETPELADLAPALSQALRETLALLRPAEERPPNATRLQQQVERSGLNYESKVLRALTTEAPLQAPLAHDFKGQLLDLAQRLTHSLEGRHNLWQGTAANLLESVQQAINALELQQIANQFALQEHRPLVLSLVSPYASPLSTLQLAIHRDDRREEHTAPASEHYTVAFALELTTLGPLHITAVVSGRAISATLQVTEPAIAAYLEREAPELVAQLQTLGWQMSVACTVQPHIALDTAPTLPQALTRTTHLVDVTT